MALKVQRGSKRLETRKNLKKYDASPVKKIPLQFWRGV
jgi:hypothetical protein